MYTSVFFLIHLINEPKLKRSKQGMNVVSPMCLIISNRHRFFFFKFYHKNQENDEKIQKKLLDSIFRGPMTMIIGCQSALKL